MYYVIIAQHLAKAWLAYVFSVAYVLPGMKLVSSWPATYPAGL